MRTKALLACAALAVGLATSAVAQSNVYSLNIVGYVNVTLHNGFTLVANPLDNGTNDLNSLFPNAGFLDTVYKFVGGAFTSSTFTGSWSPDLPLVPGEGVFYAGGAQTTNTFVGNVRTGNLTNSLPAGFSIVSSQVPISDTLENLSFPAGFLDTVYYFRNGAYVTSTFTGTWSPDLSPGVGEAFWVAAGAAEKWVQIFNP